MVRALWFFCAVSISPSYYNMCCVKQVAVVFAFLLVFVFRPILLYLMLVSVFDMSCFRLLGFCCCMFIVVCVPLFAWLLVDYITSLGLSRVLCACRDVSFRWCSSFNVL